MVLCCSRDFAAANTSGEGSVCRNPLPVERHTTALADDLMTPSTSGSASDSSSISEPGSKNVSLNSMGTSAEDI